MKIAFKNSLNTKIKIFVTKGPGGIESFYTLLPGQYDYWGRTQDVKVTFKTGEGEWYEEFTPSPTRYYEIYAFNRYRYKTGTPDGLYNSNIKSICSCVYLHKKFNDFSNYKGIRGSKLE